MRDLKYPKIDSRFVLLVVFFEHFEMISSEFRSDNCFVLDV